MCPLCMCKHQNEVHGEQAVHITSLIDDVLKQVSERMKDGVKHQEVVSQHSAKAEQLIKDKEKIRFELDARLESLMVFYTEQKGIVAENNASMLKSHERILKETQKAEYKINDNLNNPDKVANRVKDMIHEEEYWPALAEANRALVEDVVFDDAAIREELTLSEKCLHAYEEQLATLDITPLHSAKYNKLLAENADLRKENERQQADLAQLANESKQQIGKFPQLTPVEEKTAELADTRAKLLSTLCFSYNSRRTKR